MNKNITLVILAGGMGSRFGGLKQIEPMGPNGEFIIDYSVYDAIRAGFSKIIFVIRKENYDLFKETIGRRVEPHIDVQYVFQEFDTIPLDIEIPKDRVKPLGTAHAILCIRDFVKEPFAIINSDDFYGRDAFGLAYNYLSNVDVNSNMYAMIGYKAVNTLTENGSVKRGVSKIDEEGNLLSITESKLELVDGNIIASPLNGDNEFKVDKDAIVSMNFLLFTPSIFKYLEREFKLFLTNNQDNLVSQEYLIPDVIQKLITEGTCKVKVINTKEKWYGVTYREDTSSVREAIRDLVDDGVYNNRLWK